MSVLTSRPDELTANTVNRTSVTVFQDKSNSFVFTSNVASFPVDGMPATPVQDDPSRLEIQNPQWLHGDYQQAPWFPTLPRTLRGTIFKSLAHVPFDDIRPGRATRMGYTSVYSQEWLALESLMVQCTRELFLRCSFIGGRLEAKSRRLPSSYRFHEPHPDIHEARRREYKARREMKYLLASMSFAIWTVSTSQNDYTLWLQILEGSRNVAWPECFFRHGQASRTTILDLLSQSVLTDFGPESGRVGAFVDLSNGKAAPSFAQRLIAANVPVWFYWGAARSHGAVYPPWLQPFIPNAQSVATAIDCCANVPQRVTLTFRSQRGSDTRMSDGTLPFSRSTGAPVLPAKSAGPQRAADDLPDAQPTQRLERRAPRASFDASPSAGETFQQYFSRRLHEMDHWIRTTEKDPTARLARAQHASTWNIGARDALYEWEIENAQPRRIPVEPFYVKARFDAYPPWAKRYDPCLRQWDCSHLFYCPPEYSDSARRPGWRVDAYEELDEEYHEEYEAEEPLVKQYKRNFLPFITEKDLELRGLPAEQPEPGPEELESPKSSRASSPAPSHGGPPPVARPAELPSSGSSIIEYASFGRFPSPSLASSHRRSPSPPARGSGFGTASRSGRRSSLSPPSRRREHEQWSSPSERPHSGYPRELRPNDLDPKARHGPRPVERWSSAYTFPRSSPRPDQRTTWPVPSSSAAQLNSRAPPTRSEAGFPSPPARPSGAAYQRLPSAPAHSQPSLPPTSQWASSQRTPPSLPPWMPSTSAHGPLHSAQNPPLSLAPRLRPRHQGPVAREQDDVYEWLDDHLDFVRERYLWKSPPHSEEETLTRVKTLHFALITLGVWVPEDLSEENACKRIDAAGHARDLMVFADRLSSTDVTSSCPSSYALHPDGWSALVELMAESEFTAVCVGEQPLLPQPSRKSGAQPAVDQKSHQKAGLPSRPAGLPPRPAELNPQQQADVVQRPTLWLIDERAVPRLDRDWVVVVKSALAAIWCLRSGCTELTHLASRLISEGIPFYMPKRRSLIPSPAGFRVEAEESVVNSSILGWRSAEYEFGPADYLDYESRRNRFLTAHPKAARAVLLRGGIAWRLAVAAVTDHHVLAGPSDYAAATSAVLSWCLENSSLDLCEDALPDAVHDLVCGRFHRATRLQQGMVTQYWPGTRQWEDSPYHHLGWSGQAERWYQKRRRGYLGRTTPDETQPLSGHLWKKTFGSQGRAKYLSRNVLKLAEQCMSQAHIPARLGPA
jgi:hypothetical protein